MCCTTTPAPIPFFFFFKVKGHKLRWLGKRRLEIKQCNLGGLHELCYLSHIRNYKTSAIIFGNINITKIHSNIVSNWIHRLVFLYSDQNIEWFTMKILIGLKNFSIRNLCATSYITILHFSYLCRFHCVSQSKGPQFIKNCLSYFRMHRFSRRSSPFTNTPILEEPEKHVLKNHRIMFLTRLPSTKKGTGHNCSTLPSQKASKAQKKRTGYRHSGQ